MPILRIRDVRGMSSEERAKKVSDLRTELARLRTMVRAGGAVENPARIRALRKAIAKLLTIDREDKLGILEMEEKTGKRRGRKENKGN